MATIEIDPMPPVDQTATFSASLIVPPLDCQQMLGATDQDRQAGSRRDEILATAADLFATRGIRASLQDIADACGILPGSLYHHFDSKEAIAVELVQRYRAELDGLAEAVPDGPPLAAVEALATAIAACAVRHRAALLLT